MLVPVVALTGIPAESRLRSSPVARGGLKAGAGASTAPLKQVQRGESKAVGGVSVEAPGAAPSVRQSSAAPTAAACAASAFRVAA